MAGVFKYRVGVGGFLNTNSVFIQDYQHFNANRSLIAGEYVSSFQLASYYANSTDNNFYSFANIEHHFNGLLSNKIPVIKKWDWNFVAGTNAFYVNNTNNYIEVFLGFENILKIFRVDYIVAYENGKQSQLQEFVSEPAVSSAIISISMRHQKIQAKRNISFSYKYFFWNKHLYFN